MASSWPWRGRKRFWLTPRRKPGPWPRRPIRTMRVRSAAMSGRQEGRGPMRIVGEWQLGEDRVTRPTVAGEVLGADGRPFGEHFLIDSGADRTIVSAHLLGKLQFTGNHQPPGFALVGVSGPAAAVLLTTVIEFIR